MMIRRALRSICFASLALFALAVRDRLAAGENWPQFRGPDGQGHSDAKGLPTEWSETKNVRWKTPIHDKGWSSPVVWGNQVWLTTGSDEGKRLYAICVDLASGAIVHDLKIFDVANPTDIRVYNTYASPTPVIEAGRVYVHFGSAGTACLDTATGKVIWQRRDLPCNHFRGPGSSPILFGNLLIIHFDGFDYQYIVALDKQTGETVWKRDRDIDYGTTDGDTKKAFATPLVIDVAGRQELISPTSKATLAYDPHTGQELWRVRYPEFSAAGRPVFGDGLLFISTGFGKAQLWAVRPGGHGDVTSTNVAWKFSKAVGSKPSPLWIDGLLYLVNDSGVAACVEAKTGKQVWSHRFDNGGYSAAPLSADGHVYLFSDGGVTTVLRPGRKYEEVAVNHLEGSFMASPAVASHALILRTKTNLYRIESR
jgi:outer membrane protein assembly factor BamB